MTMAEVRYSDNILFLSGELTAQNIPGTQNEVFRLLHNREVSRLDTSGLDKIDSAGAALCEEIILRASEKGDLTILPAKPEVQEVINTFRSLDLVSVPKPKQSGFLESLGETLLKSGQGFKEALYVASEIFYWSVVGIFNRKGARKGSLSHQCILLGQNATPIVSLLSFIIGLIIALQVAIQAKNFGASLFLADIMSIAIVCELSPLFTAIIVAGRSGSSIAAEIATMQVTQEVDALKMMALNPFRYVVVPKFHALTLMMPILVAFSILLGQLGSILIAVIYLDINPGTYITRSINILGFSDILVTFIKSTVFAWLIVIIGSYYGFRVRGGAEEVGKATTASVVSSIFAVIIADAVFSILYL